MTYLKIALALLLVGVGGFSVWSYRHMAQKAATADQRIEAAEKAAADAKRTAKAAQESADALAKEIVSRAEIDRAIREARQNITISLDEVQREDSAARDYLGEPIPRSVRDAITNGGRQPVPSAVRD